MRTKIVEHLHLSRSVSEQTWRKIGIDKIHREERLLIFCTDHKLRARIASNSSASAKWNNFHAFPSRWMFCGILYYKCPSSLWVLSLYAKVCGPCETVRSWWPRPHLPRTRKLRLSECVWHCAPPKWGMTGRVRISAMCSLLCEANASGRQHFVHTDRHTIASNCESAALIGEESGANRIRNMFSLAYIVCGRK